MVPQQTGPTLEAPRVGPHVMTDGQPSSRAARVVREIAAEHLIWPIVVLMVILGSFVPGFLTTGNFINLMWGAAPLGCMVVGLYFVMMTGRLDLSLESTYALGPTVAVLFMTSWVVGLSPVLGIGITLLVGALVGLINGFLSVTLGVNPFLVTLATLLIIRGVVVYLIPEGIYNLPSGYTALGGERIGGTIPLAVFVLLGLIAIAWAVMRYTTFGRNLVAIGNNEKACRVAGINVPAVCIGAFVVAGTCAALGGLLSAGRLFSVDASMGDGDILIVFAATTLGGTALAGGKGRVTGLLGALFVIGGITNLMNLVGVDATVRQIVFGVVLLLAIMLSSVQQRLRRLRT
jgi:ribose/xylose/arabinose/galactoside ABC-type transport system permease subunit